MKAKSVFWGLTGLSLTLFVSLLFIVLGAVYWMITAWIIKAGAAWAGLGAVDGATVVLTAGIVTAATIIGAAIQQ